MPTTKPKKLPNKCPVCGEINYRGGNSIYCSEDCKNFVENIKRKTKNANKKYKRHKTILKER